MIKCPDCKFSHKHVGHGECWTQCNHTDSPQSYDSIIFGCNSQFKNIPFWCPLEENNEIIEEQKKQLNDFLNTPEEIRKRKVKETGKLMMAIQIIKVE